MIKISPIKKRRVTRRALALFILGLAVSATIYVNTPPDVYDPFGFDVQNNKAYLLQMEKIGGQANVMAEQLKEWFMGLWHGQSLAYTIAVLSAFASFAYWFIALHHEPAVADVAKSADVTRKAG